jgi:hypothetical protein
MMHDDMKPPEAGHLVVLGRNLERISSVDVLLPRRGFFLPPELLCRPTDRRPMTSRVLDGHPHLALGLQIQRSGSTAGGGVW